MELIRELMQTQRMSVRKISAQIAKEHGGSALGYTQQINRILNDPDYDPTFSTVQKILAALNCSLWQTAPTVESSAPIDVEHLEARLDRLDDRMADLKATIDTLGLSVRILTKQLEGNRLEAGN